MSTIIHDTKQFSRYLRHTRAVSALEYAMLIGVIAVVIAAVLVTLGDNITTAIETIGTEVEGINSPGDIELE